MSAPLDGLRQVASLVAMDEAASPREKDLGQVLISVIEELKQLRRDMERRTDPRLYAGRP